MEWMKDRHNVQPARQILKKWSQMLVPGKSDNRVRREKVVVHSGR
jgi:hypothetical protein